MVAWFDDAGPPFGPRCEQHVRLNFAISRERLEQLVTAMGDAVTH